MKEPTNPLSEQLRALRNAAGLSGAEAAKRSGLSQAKISRVETGAFMPTPDQVDRLCRVYGAPADVRKTLVQMMRDFREATQSARVTLQRGGWQMQVRIGRIEASSSLLRSFSSDTVIGLVQAEPYIRAMLSEFLEGDDLARTVRARLDRHSVLDSDRRFSLIMSEGALRWNVGGAKVMIDQLSHLTEVSYRQNVRLGVIPWTTTTRLPGVHAFHLYDSSAVIVGTMNATAIMTDSRDVEEYKTWFDRLDAVASFDDDARAIINRIAADYQAIT